MTAFQRARNDEQREQRRAAILVTAASMLDEMGVAALSLNELSRRVGLAKSNVMRYFESREAVLLELLHAEATDFLEQVVGPVSGRVDSSLPPRQRIDAIAAELTHEYVRHPILCELLSAQAAVLERNVSTPVAIRYKRESLASIDSFAEAMRSLLPELGTAGAARAVWLITVLVGALWSHGHPTPAVEAAFEQDPSLERARAPFAQMLEQSIVTVLVGQLEQGRGEV